MEATYSELSQKPLLASHPENREKIGPPSPSEEDVGSSEIIRRHTSPLPPTSLRNEYHSEGRDILSQKLTGERDILGQKVPGERDILGQKVPLRRTATGPTTRTSPVSKDLDTVHERDESPLVDPVRESADNAKVPDEKVEPVKGSVPVEQNLQDQSPNAVPQSGVTNHSVPVEKVTSRSQPATDSPATDSHPTRPNPIGLQPHLSRHGTDAPPPTPSAISPKTADAQDNENGLHFKKQPSKLEKGPQPLPPQRDGQIASGPNST